MSKEELGRMLTEYFREQCVIEDDEEITVSSHERWSLPGGASGNRITIQGRVGLSEPWLSEQDAQPETGS